MNAATKRNIDWQFLISIPVLVVLPFITPYQAIATYILIFAMFATGMNILLGYTGQLSFGHASFYGLGAYGTGLLIVKLQWPLWAAMMGGV
ncbi:MAG: branched-chain amino acid ABC transporter permease, partial [Deltaproteobacteria bacterium]|nr:branched-chain amino acid ABC transporter permease [Deltaproteobacteria bacterium]